MDRRKLLASMASLPLALSAPALFAQSNKKRESKRRKAANAPHSHVDVAIIGAGALGAWTAWHLIRRGKSVRLFDAYGAGNGRAASNLQTMLLDPAQDGDPLYAALAGDSMAAWNELNDSASLPMVRPLPIVTALSPSDAAYRTGQSGLQAGAALRSRYPQMGWQDAEYGLIGQDGLMIAGRRALLECLADARLQVEDAVMPSPLPDKRSGRYALPDGGTASQLVYTSGAWLTEIFPQLLTPQRLSAVRHHVFHFGAGQGDVQFRPPAMPAIIDRAAGYSAIPDLEGRGVRVWTHHADASVDPDSFDRRSDDRILAAVRQWLYARLPRLANAPVIASSAAHDCRTITGDLLMDRFPNHSKVWMVGGGVGRAFGLAPTLGERVAEHVTNPNRAIEPRWSLAALLGSSAS
jgi:glycine/D-amino acid oxidase-like deaminating enzyme